MRYITRTFKVKQYEVYCVKEDDLSQFTITVDIGPGKNKNKCIKEAAKANDGVVVKVVEKEEKSYLYRMPEEDFLRDAELVEA